MVTIGDFSGIENANWVDFFKFINDINQILNKEDCKTQKGRLIDQLGSAFYDDHTNSFTIWIGDDYFYNNKEGFGWECPINKQKI